VIKLPDGTLNIGTESKDKHIVTTFSYNLSAMFRKKFYVGIVKVDYYTSTTLIK
jgi:hypothetical protein